MIKKYQGVALHKSLGERERSSGEISFSNNMFSFNNGVIHKTLSLSGIKIEMVKTGVSLYYFSNPIEPEWRFYTSDKTILKDVSLSNNDIVAMIRNKNFKNNLLRVSSIVSTLLLIVFIIMFAISLKDNVVVYISDKIPVAWEQKLGEYAFEEYKKNIYMINDDSTDKMLKNLTDPLINSLEDKRYTFEFHVARDKEVNAFALPGGQVIINSGLIDLAETPEEIMGVLAHEIAHVQKKHSIRQIINDQQIHLIIKYFFGDLSGVSDVLVNSSSFLLSQSYSREFELEADKIGLEYLLKADINPNGIIDFFQKLEEESSINLDETLEKVEDFERSLVFLSSHPETKERISILKNEITKLPSKTKNSKMNFDLNGLKQAVNKSTNSKGD